MKTALIIISLLLVVPPLLGLAFYYWRYRGSPLSQWKRTVLRHVRELETRRDDLRNESSGLERTIAQLADQSYMRYLGTISLDRLNDYPNIGPVTIERIRDAGYRRLSDVLRTSFEGIRDVGPVRADALRVAVRAMEKDARSRFESGGCPEAQEFRRQMDEMRQAEREKTVRRERDLAAIEIALKDSQELRALAHAITFRSFVMHGEVEGLTPEVMARSMPEPRPMPPAPPPQARVITPPPAPPIPVAEEVKPEPRPPADLFRAELDSHAAPVTNRGDSTEYPGLAKLRAVVGFGFAIAKADGKVAQAERKQIRAYLDAAFAHDVTLLRNIDPAIEQIEKAIPDEDDAIAAVRDFSMAERTALFAWAERIADASGERNARERDALARIAAGLGLSKVEERVPEPKTLPVEPAADPRAILEIAPDVKLDADLIRRRYAMLTEKLDPAKAAVFGPEFARMADEKRTRIRAAAESLIARFQEPLEKVAPPVSSDLRHNPDLDDVFG